MPASAVPGDGEIRDDRIALRFAHGPDRLETNCVARDLERVPWREGLLSVDGSRLACRDGERDEHDPDMHDVAAVSAAATAQQVRERGEPAFAVKRAAGP